MSYLPIGRTQSQRLCQKRRAQRQQHGYQNLLQLWQERPYCQGMQEEKTSKLGLCHLFFLWRRGPYRPWVSQKWKRTILSRRRLLPVWLSETHEKRVSRTPWERETKQVPGFRPQEEKRRSRKSRRRTRLLNVFYKYH